MSSASGRARMRIVAVALVTLGVLAALDGAIPAAVVFVLAAVGCAAHAARGDGLG